MADRNLAIVVGAAGGIGGALATKLHADPAYDHLLSLSRQRPEGWTDDERRTWHPVDILDEASLAAAAARARDMGAPGRIIVATGRLQVNGVAPEKAMRSLDLATLTSLFAINAAGPALVAKHFLPLTPRQGPSLFAVLSARVGSISDNHLGGWYGYRAAKAALNMLVRTLAIEHRRTRPLGLCVALHPGTVETDLSAPFRGRLDPGKLFSTPQAANALLALMDRLGPEDNGSFLAWDGSPIPW